MFAQMPLDNRTVVEFAAVAAILGVGAPPVVAATETT